MIDPENVSPIGLGTYRMGNLKEDADSLQYAVESGCNLVDTASNYLYGQSEKLIGRYIKEHPDKELFVVTKAGYISHKDEPAFVKLMGKKLTPDDVTKWKSTNHCIHPAFLHVQIKASLKNLNRKYLDGFLLHNPEYFLKAASGTERNAIYYERIKTAFEFLEGLVSKGLIRYYGISSNTLAASPDDPAATDLSILLKIAKEVSTNNHFRLVQFPYNLVENNATQKNNGDSLIETARKNGIITFANRPLNVHADTGFMRLAIYYDELNEQQEKEAEAAYSSFVELIAKQLKKQGADNGPLDYDIMVQFSKAWNKAGNHGSVDLLYSHLAPFLAALFEYEVIPGGPLTAQKMKKKEQKLISQLYQYSLLHSTRIMNEKSRSFLNDLKAQGLVDKNDTRPLSVIACEYYLQQGLDHVLVGMRKKSYVDELRHLFRK
jgi:aryl-alcohol dehydrogenase-like predicted oxidoreductase